MGSDDLEKNNSTPDEKEKKEDIPQWMLDKLFSQPKKLGEVLLSIDEENRITLRDSLIVPPPAYFQLLELMKTNSTEELVDSFDTEKKWSDAEKMKKGFFDMYNDSPVVDNLLNYSLLQGQSLAANCLLINLREEIDRRKIRPINFAKNMADIKKLKPEKMLNFAPTSECVLDYLTDWNREKTIKMLEIFKQTFLKKEATFCQRELKETKQPINFIEYTDKNADKFEQTIGQERIIFEKNELTGAPDKTKPRRIKIYAWTYQQMYDTFGQKLGGYDYINRNRINPTDEIKDETEKILIKNAKKNLESIASYLMILSIFFKKGDLVELKKEKRDTI
jgi:hypothetical protein